MLIALIVSNPDPNLLLRICFIKMSSNDRMKESLTEIYLMSDKFVKTKDYSHIYTYIFNRKGCV